MLASPTSKRMQQMTAECSFSALHLEPGPGHWAHKAHVGTPNLSIAQKIDGRSEHTHLIGLQHPNTSGIIIRSPKHMLGLERVWEARNQTPVLVVSGAIIVAIALLDWWTTPFVSLGFLYLFPIMLAAGFLPRWAVAFLGVTCAILAERFSALPTSLTRLSLETLALAGCGLFVGELIRNRRMSLEAQERLRALVETSPAAIVTVDERGFIELANRAAGELMAPRDGKLVGNPIAAFLPELHHALRWEEAPQFRASMQCRGHKGNGEVFMADVWFSTYKEGQSPKVAAIIGDISEETPAGLNLAPSENQDRISLNNRELEVLRLLVQGLANKEIAAKLEISESAVKNTLQQLFTKSGVRTRSHLVRVALEHHRNLL
jgi:PAS domain S-box-containing protein